MSAADVIVPTGVTHAIINPSSGRRHGVMRALTLVADRQLVIAQVPAPPPPRADEVQIAFTPRHRMRLLTARPQPAPTALGGSRGAGPGSFPMVMAKAIGGAGTTPDGDHSKSNGVIALCPHHVIKYRKDRFEHETRKITKK